MIAKELGCCRNTINTLITRWKKEGGDIKHVPKRKKGSGRPRLLTDQRLQEILKHFEQNPSISVPQLKNILPELRHISDRTLQRNVKERLKLISRRVAKKPVLTEKMIQDRLLFCRRYRNWSANKWLKVLFTDESMFRVVNLGKQQNNTAFVRRPKGSNRYDPKYTRKTVGQSEGVMVWGGFCGAGKTSLYVLPKKYRQDAKFKNKRKLKGMDWEACLDCFKKKMMPGFRKFRCSHLLQDKAPCHRHRNVVKYLADRGVEVIQWAGNSPDLNPIENLWSIIKRRLKLKDCSTRHKCILAIRKVWKDIPKSLLVKLATSMPRRIAEVEERGGNITHY